MQYVLVIRKYKIYNSSNIIGDLIVSKIMVEKSDNNFLVLYVMFKNLFVVKIGFNPECIVGIPIEVKKIDHI